MWGFCHLLRVICPNYTFSDLTTECVHRPTGPTISWSWAKIPLVPILTGESGWYRVSSDAVSNSSWRLWAFLFFQCIVTLANGCKSLWRATCFRSHCMIYRQEKRWCTYQPEGSGHWWVRAGSYQLSGANCVHLFSTLFSDIMLVAWNWLSWECLFNRNWQMLQIWPFPASPSWEPVAKLFPVSHRGELGDSAFSGSPTQMSHS